VRTTLLAISCALALQATSALAGPRQNSTLTFHLTDNVIRFPVVVNGHKVGGALDSGTGTLALDRKFALSLGLRPGKMAGTAAGGGAVAEPVYPVTIARLAFGPERLTHVAGMALNLSRLSAANGFPVDVILGRPAFEQRALRINYPKRRITFLAPGAEAACADPIPIRFAGGVPIVSVTLQATPSARPARLHMIVDLGTRYWAAMVGGPFLNTAEGRTLEKQGVRAHLGTGTGGRVEGKTVQIAEMVVGKHKFRDLTIGLANHVKAFQLGVADGSLGVPLWDKGTITFDDADHRLCLHVPMKSRMKHAARAVRLPKR
jgi:hypothetical protein